LSSGLEVAVPLKDPFSPSHQLAGALDSGLKAQPVQVLRGHIEPGHPDACCQKKPAGTTW
jgi:hypothetical protein